MSLFIDSAIVRRIGNLHHAMEQRAKPRYWKSGVRKGQIRTPGLDALPFTRQDLREYVLELLGGTTPIPCPYCLAIGRPAALIDIRNCVLDHHESIKRVGLGAWRLSNLRPCCADCNALKGEMDYDVFVAVLSALYKMVREDPATLPDLDYLLRCLRTQGTVMQGWTAKNKGKQPQPLPQLKPVPKQRLLTEDF